MSTPSIYMVDAKPQRYLGKCEPCDRPVAMSLDNVAQPYPSNLVIPCVDCFGSCDAELLYGVINKMTCDARCEGARGPLCVCGCGGVNHGAVWEETIDNVSAHIVEAYRADVARRKAAAERRHENKQKQLEELFAIWLEDHEQAWLILSYDGDNYFLNDLKEELKSCKILSDRQMDAAIRTLAQEQAREQKARNISLSTFQGTPGDKITITVRIEKIIWLRDFYKKDAKKPMYVLVDNDGNVYVWYASSAIVLVQGQFGTEDVAKQGDTVTLNTTVKDHKEYEGVQQTVITRAKVVYDNAR